MRIGWIVPGGFDPGGAAGTIPAITSLALELSRSHRLRVFAAGGRGAGGRYRVGDIEVTQLADRAAAGRAGAMALWRWWRSAGPFDVIHAFWVNRTALAVGLFAKLCSTPMALTVGGGEPVWLPGVGGGYGGAGTRRGRTLTRIAFGIADAVTAGTPFIARAFPAPLAGRLEIVPLGVRCDRFAALPTRSPGPPWRLVHVANLNEVKDQRMLLSALRRVVDRMGEVHLDCIGQDTLGGAIQAYARQLGLAARVTFHGYLPQDQLAPFYRRAHLHVLSSRHESQGVVVLEAAAAGLPTVGTCVGSIDTLAPAGARAVPVGDAAALAGEICALLTDAPAREAMGAAAQRFARAHDLAWTARTFEAIYARLRPSP